MGRSQLVTTEDISSGRVGATAWSPFEIHVAALELPRDAAIFDFTSVTGKRSL